MTATQALGDPTVATSGRPSRLVPTILRARWALLAAFAVVACLGARGKTFGDWYTFAWGAAVLTGQHAAFPFTRFVPHHGLGLHIYANFRVLQMGPLSLLAAAPIRLLGPDHGRLAAVAMCELLALGVIFLTECTYFYLFPHATPRETRWMHGTVLVGGFLALAAWFELAGRWVHLDDAMAVSACSGAVAAVLRRKPWLAGALIGVAAGSKTWAIGILPLLLALPRGQRRKGGLAAAGVFLLTWGPFLVADPGTLKIGSFPIWNQPASALTALGVASPHLLTHPGAWRLGQFTAELLVVAWAVRRGSVPAAMMLCIAARLITDPQALSYYPASLVIAAFVFDMLHWRRPAPIFTSVAALAWIVDLQVARVDQPWPHLLIYAAVVVGCLAAISSRPRWLARLAAVSERAPAVSAA